MARTPEPVRVPEPLTTEELEDRKAFYFMRDTAIYRALDELLSARRQLTEEYDRARAFQKEVDELRDEHARLRANVLTLIEGLEVKDPRAFTVELRTAAKALGLIDG